MKKKKILGIIISAVIAISSIVPAFADTITQDQGTSTTQSEIKRLTPQERLAKLTQRATKLGIDINGLNNKQAKEKIMESEAVKLGVDITGLTNKEARDKIKEARQETRATATVLE